MNCRTLAYNVIILFLIFIVVPIMGEGFIASTLVKTPQGYIAIENLHNGDQIFCCNENGEMLVSTITAIQKNISSQLTIITTNAISITADSNQLFYHASKRSWSPANTLTKNDLLFSCSCKPFPINAIHFSNDSFATYSLSVKNHPNFFISEHDILVHNMAILVAAPVAAPIITSVVVIAAAKTVAAMSIFGGCIYAFFGGSSSKNNSNNHNHSPHNNNNDGPCWCGHSCKLGCNCGCACNCSERFKKQNDCEYTYRNGKYEDAGYHTKNSVGNSKSGKSPAPIDGQKALDNSIKIPGGGNGRIGVSQGQIVVLGKTLNNTYHGHIITWKELESASYYRKALNEMIKQGLINNKGKILK